MLTGRRFVIWGLSRLSVRVARALAAQRAVVTVVLLRGEADERRAMLGAGVTVLEASAEEAGEALARAGLAGADCLLALSENDLDNLRGAVAARDLDATVPVVLRAFDPLLAGQLEQGWNVRRAYSVSALAAPAFVAAACGDRVLETLRLGDGEAPICRLTVRPGSPLIGLDAGAVKRRFGCALVARLGGDGTWQSAQEETAGVPLAEGDQALLGGPREDVLKATARNAGWRKGKTKRPARQAKPGPNRRPTRLPQIAAALLAILVLAVFVFGHFLHLRAVDAFYFVVTTATTTGYGDISLHDAPDWLKLFGCLVMLIGGALLGIVFSYLAAFATAERLGETMRRRARRLSGHVVVAGLGNLGYRAALALDQMGLDVAVVSRAPDERFANALPPHVPVLSGDVSLPGVLDQVSIDSAVALIACTNDELANVQACLYARDKNKGIRTVARVYDDALGERLGPAFPIDHALSASGEAVSAFVGAATDELALRPLSVGDLTLLAGRHSVEESLTAEVLAAWRSQGVRVLAWRFKSGPLRPRPASEIVPPLAPETELILCGPAEAVRGIIR